MVHLSDNKSLWVINSTSSNYSINTKSTKLIDKTCVDVLLIGFSVCSRDMVFFSAVVLILIFAVIGWTGSLTIMSNISTPILSINLS